MVDLFAGIPEENIVKSLDWISQNLDKVGLEGGHTLRRHTDIQVRALQFRLKEEDVRFATSFWDAEIAAAVVLELLQKNYQAEIWRWLRRNGRDDLVLTGRFPKSVGYGFRKGVMILEENLKQACVTLVKDLQADWGFRVLTSYPIFERRDVIEKVNPASGYYGWKVSNPMWEKSKIPA